MSEKNEVQLRNEAEVRRIMEERGYTSSSNRKRANTAFRKHFSLKPFVFGSILIATAVAGGFVLLNPPETKDTKEDQYAKIAKIEEDMAQTSADFQLCLSSANGIEISTEDSDFWDKSINRYKDLLSCYDRYSDVANANDRASLQESLAKLEDLQKKRKLNHCKQRRIPKSRPRAQSRLPSNHCRQ